MPSPRSSPAVRPVSPLSPGYKSPHFDSLQPPTPRATHARTSMNSQRRLPTKSLKLPALPRFHPANYPSQNSSVQTTPDDQSPGQPPMSPRTHQRMYSDAQRQLFLHQRELVATNMRGSWPANQSGKPISPRLEPLGSPGPVTPLALEGEEGYLVAGARTSAGQNANPNEIVEQLIREETRRQFEKSR